MMSQKLTFEQLTKLVSDEMDISQRFVRTFTHELVSVIKEGLNRDGKVNLSKLGIFELKQVEEREGRDPETGEQITIPAHQKVVFKPYKDVRKRINAPYEELEATFASEDEIPRSDTTNLDHPPFIKKNKASANRPSNNSLYHLLTSNSRTTIVLASGVTVCALLIGWGIHKLTQNNKR